MRFSRILISSEEQLCETLLDGYFLQLTNNTGGKVRQKTFALVFNYKAFKETEKVEARKP